jgi:hypothetical protein
MQLPPTILQVSEYFSISIFVITFMYRSVPVCTLEFPVISTKFCDLNLLRWAVGTALQCG